MKHNFKFSIEVDDNLSREEFTLLIASVHSKIKQIEGNHKVNGTGPGGVSTNVDSFVKVTNESHSNHEYVLKTGK